MGLSRVWGASTCHCLDNWGTWPLVIGKLGRPPSWWPRDDRRSKKNAEKRETESRMKSWIKKKKQFEALGWEMARILSATQSTYILIGRPRQTRRKQNVIKGTGKSSSACIGAISFNKTPATNQQWRPPSISRSCMMTWQRNEAVPAVQTCRTPTGLALWRKIHRTNQPHYWLRSSCAAVWAGSVWLQQNIRGHR